MGTFLGVKGRSLNRQYKEALSSFKTWDQRSHARQWVLYPDNIGLQLSIDETSLTHDELYTIITNKEAKGRKGSIVAIIAGTRAEKVIEIVNKIPELQRAKVKGITLDMAGNMELIAKRCFPSAVRVTDRFHVQKLASEALQELRIKYRWEALDAENEAIEKAKQTGVEFSLKSLKMAIHLSNYWRVADMYCIKKLPTGNPANAREQSCCSKDTLIYKRHMVWPPN